MSCLIIFCSNSATDPFCLALQLQAPCPQRLGLRSRFDSLTVQGRVWGVFFHHVSEVDSAFDFLILDCACF